MRGFIGRFLAKNAISVILLAFAKFVIRINSLIAFMQCINKLKSRSIMNIEKFTMKK